MNYTAATYSNINPVVFYGGGFCGGVDPRREQYAGEDVAGVEVPDYKTKYEALQNVIKDNYQLFEVDYYGIDNDNYVDGAGFCCEPKAQAKNARSLPTENVDYEKLQYYYHSDHLGSASYITNLDGEVVQHIEYVPFGEVFLEERNNTWNTPFLFNGKELDEETGLYYYGARYYNPRVSLWYGVDPLAEKYPAHSPYCYTMNNPVMLVDPDGRKPNDYTINYDGTIEVTLTNDDFDRFYLKSTGFDGQEASTTLIGQFDKNESGLIQLDDFSYANYNFGTSFSFDVKDGNESHSYIRGDALASLLGAMAITNFTDITVIGVSNSDGSSPAPSVSHKDGKNMDFRYLKTDETGERILLGQRGLDIERQNSFNDALYKFGWTDMLSEKFKQPGQTTNTLLNRTRHYDKSRHHNHLHIQGYNPNLIYNGGTLSEVIVTP